MSKEVTPHSAIDSLIRLPGVGILFAAGTTVPADGSSGYARGCYFAHLDGGDNTSAYINEGDQSAADFNPLTP